MSVKNIPLRFYDNRENDVKAHEILERECNSKKLSKQRFIIEAILFYDQYKDYPFDNIVLSKDEMLAAIKEQVAAVLGSKEYSVISKSDNNPVETKKAESEAERQIVEEIEAEDSSDNDIADEAMDFLKELM